eukprot:CAMPEP_0181478342 /NCGR_PEP_ID=MMETSP1110-20121109/42692_1 /TAXON_ID=174948 /ORGANISM="Symbiodinium sp., Strain CCMP421" /LENGTH=209 /DNA_ID=CAMNT_0023603691 /DNA_START=54 /DNA_END=682 /DNA_ORIENTATION=-
MDHHFDLVVKNTFYTVEIEDAASPGLRRQESSPAMLCRQGEPTFAMDRSCTKNEAAEVSSQEDMASSTTASHHEFWDPEETRTSMMIKNLPSTLSGQALKDLIDNEGFNASYDFLYLPMKFISKQPFGYAFVNLISADMARDFWVHFDGFHLHGSTLAMSWSTDIQGIDQHIAAVPQQPCDASVSAGGVQALAAEGRAADHLPRAHGTD